MYDEFMQPILKFGRVISYDQIHRVTILFAAVIGENVCASKLL